MKINKEQNIKIESSHAVHAVSKTKKGLLWSFILTGLFFIIELIVGLKIGSVAVVADAAHNFSAAAGVGIALFAMIFSQKPPTPKRTFGFLKMEILSAWINGIVLFIMAFFILKMGIKNLLYPEVVNTTPMVILAIIGLIIAGIPAFMLYEKQKTDINVRGAFWHVMETLFGSAVVLIAGLLMRYTGWLQADAILGMLLAPVLFIAAWSIIKDSTKSLLDLTPKNLDLIDIKKNIENISGVISMHHIHAWSVGNEKNNFTAHVKVGENENIQEILEKITKLLKEKYKIYFSTLQIETKCNDLEAEEINFI